MIRATALALVALIPACEADETVAAYGGADRTWVLVEQNGVPFSGRATLEFGADGAASGQGPCNRFSFVNSVPYPWFEAGPVAATRMACPDLAAETTYFENLGAMTRVVISEGKMTMANDLGGTMVFTTSD